MNDSGESLETDTRTRVLGMLAVALFAVVGLVMLGWAHTALDHGNVPTAVVAGLVALSMVCLVAGGTATIMGVEPRADYTTRGLEIRPASYLDKLVWIASVSFFVAMALGAVLYATGHLDVHPVGRRGRRRANGLFALALATPFVIGIHFLPALRAWISGERKLVERNPAVLLSVQGVQVDRRGVARLLPWDHVADVRVAKINVPNVLVIDSKDGPPLITEKLSLLGGPWLVDTIRNYWQHPRERSRLTATGPTSA